MQAPHRIGPRRAIVAAFVFCAVGPAVIGMALPVLVAQAILLAVALTLAVHAGWTLPWREWLADTVRAIGSICCVAAVTLLAQQASLARLIALLPVVVTGPVVEEWVYRGLLRRAGREAVRVERAAPIIARRTGWRLDADVAAMRALAAFAGSVTFAAAHGAPFLLARFGLSVACGLAFHALAEPDGRLTAPILTHAGVNAVILSAVE